VREVTGKEVALIRWNGTGPVRHPSFCLHLPPSSGMSIEDDIARVEQHIREIEQRMDHQLAIIAQAEESGLPTERPRAFLVVLKQTLGLSRDHLARLLADQVTQGGR